MIRKWFIMLAAGALVSYMGAKFVQDGLFYSPLAEIQETESNADEKGDVQEEYLPGWGVEIAGKNLFSQSRGKEAPQPEAIEEPDLTPPLQFEPTTEKHEITLNGIIINQYGEYVAYIRIDDNPTIELKKGDIREGISISNITGRNVTLMWEGKQITLSLSKLETLTR